jgi:hypothetical protein
MNWHVYYKCGTSIQAGLGIMDHENSELAELGIETKPEDVLAEVERLTRLS